VGSMSLGPNGENCTTYRRMEEKRTHSETRGREHYPKDLDPVEGLGGGQPLALPHKQDEALGAVVLPAKRKGFVEAA